ncbi:hypothetical protein [Amycolatopsis samaneae]|uniref:Uncharacterized protein n=1 Tax=Amycolatopsis samaneae TaxID=664691 RepID=A0ABW5G8R5_9PSEU
MAALEKAGVRAFAVEAISRAQAMDALSSALGPGRRAPALVTEDAVKGMAGRGEGSDR